MPGDRHSPDLGNGFTRIANELLEAVAAHQFNATQMAVLMLLMRETYGFQRKSAELSLTRLEQSTGRSRAVVKRAVRELVEAGVIQVASESSRAGKARKLSLQKRYRQWRVDLIGKVGSKTTPGAKDSTPQGGVENDPTPGVENDPTLGSKTTPPSTGNPRDRGAGGHLKKHLKKERKKDSAERGSAERAKSNGKEPDPRIKRLVDLYHHEYTARFNEKPAGRWAPTAAKQIERALGEGDTEDAIAGLTRAFFRHQGDPFVGDGATVGRMLSGTVREKLRALERKRLGFAQPSDGGLTDDEIAEIERQFLAKKAGGVL